MKELAKEDLKKFHEAANHAANSEDPQAWRHWRTLIQSLGLSSSEATRFFYNRSVQRSYSQIHGPVHREFAKLAGLKRSRSTTRCEAAELVANQRRPGPQFGGAAPWINEVRRCFCPRCDQEQVFYAAASETDAFQTRICLNPDGYVYYFACLNCLIISTRVDNT